MDEKNLIPEDETLASQHPDYKSEIAAVIRSDLAPKPMRDRLANYHENDIAMVLELLTPEERKKLYGFLEPAVLANILEYSDEPNLYLDELNIRKRLEILSKLEVPVAVDYLQHLEKSERGTIIDLLDGDTRQEVTLALSFDEDDIGSRMTTNYVAIHNGIGVRQAMRELIDQAAENDNIVTIYMVDEDGTFSGAIDLKDLIIAREGSDLDAIIRTSYPYVYANEQIEDCIERIQGYSEDSIPVLDADNKLKGVLTAQDITDLVDDALCEDCDKLAGLTAEEDLQEPLKKSIGKRLPCLIVLLGLGLLNGAILGTLSFTLIGLYLILFKAQPPVAVFPCPSAQERL